MIPKNDSLISDIKIIERPSETYKMNLDNNTVVGLENNNLKAMEQAIYKILNTERYKYIIYSWNYGIELEDLFGMPVSYCIPEIERRIKEALLNDTRILNVENFNFEIIKKGIIFAKFVVYTIFGNLDINREVKIT